MGWRGSDREFEAVLVDESPPNPVVNGKRSRCRKRRLSGKLKGEEIFFWADLVDLRMRKWVDEIAKDFARVEEGLAKWVLNKPNRSWLGSCSKGGGLKFGVGEHGTAPPGKIWIIVYEANPLRFGMRSRIHGEFRFLNRRGVSWKGQAGMDR